MRTHRILPTACLAAILLFAFAAPSPASAANECQLYYQYMSSNGTVQSATLDLNQGEVKPVGQEQVRYIRNNRDHPVEVEVTNLWPPYGKKWVTLNANGDQDPPSGNYTGQVTLYNAECGGQSFASPEQLVGTLKAAGIPVEDIAAQVAQTFDQSGQQVAALLEGAGFTAAQIAAGLRNAYDASGEQAAQWMAQSGIWARYVAAGLKEAYNASGEQVASWLRQANFSASQVAQGLIEAFGASAAEAAAWLADAGFTASQIAQALQDKFNTSVATFLELMKTELCGVAGCPSDRFQQIVEALRDQYNQTAAQAYALLMQAGFTAGQVAAVLTEVYNASGEQIAQWLRQSGVAAEIAVQALADAFNAGGAQVGAWLRQAGFTVVQVGVALQDHFNASVDVVARWLNEAGFTLTDVALALREGLKQNASATAEMLRGLYRASDDALRAALEFAGFTSAQIAEAFVGTIALENVISGYTGGYHGIPIAGPREAFPLEPGSNKVTFRGAGLIAVTAVAGLPSGARATILDRGAGQTGRVGWDYLHVQIDVPTSARSGSRGAGRLMVGRVEGPTFVWVVQETTPTRTTTTPTRGTPTRGTTTSRLPDLEPATFVNNLYVVGSATTMDAAGDTFTALDPFTGSAFCQGIPQGGTARNNMPTSNTALVTVPDVRWGVENTSGVDVGETFTVTLMLGRRAVATEVVGGLRAGETRTFTYRRPMSTTTVARVGPGDGCYHAGLAREGWNDNEGYTVEVDAGRTVDESSESNNARSL